MSSLVKVLRSLGRADWLKTLAPTVGISPMQILKASHDYSQFLQTVIRLGLDYAALEEAFRRTAFNVMAANCDDHTRNISFMLREGMRWELASAYDVTYAYNPDGRMPH